MNRFASTRFVWAALVILVFGANATAYHHYNSRGRMPTPSSSWERMHDMNPYAVFATLLPNMADSIVARWEEQQQHES